MRRLCIILALAAFCSITPRAKADLIVDSWRLLTGVSDNAGQQFRSFDVVQNPFTDSHTALRGLSLASATYDFAWTGDDAHFNLTADHHLEQLRGETITSGRIILRPAVDSIVTFAGTRQYNWPGAALGSTSLLMWVYDLDTEELVAINSANGGNLGLGPPFGTLNIGGTGPLLAGNDHFLYYSIKINHIDPTPPGTFGTGAGTFNFTITPVPEPSALALVALPLLVIRRRFRRG